MKKRGRLKKFIIFVLLAASIVYLLHEFNLIPERKYENKDFNIETYVSKTDMDGDGIDDQTDILQNVREYIRKKPKYESKYYAGGYPDDECGVCTDVVAFGLCDAGYDLMELVNDDILNNREKYNIEIVDKNIDFRRVANLKVFFDSNAIPCTTDVSKIGEWQGGDIVVFKNHIGIVSDKRNKNGTSFVIHHGRPNQKYYEEDILETRDDIIGHYRMS